MSNFYFPALREALVPAPGPRRVLGVATFVNNFGLGLVMTAMTLFFTGVTDLSTRQVGVGLTVAGIVGILGGIPVGELADRYGPREVARVVLLVEALVTAGYVLVQGFVAFLVVASLEMLSISAFMAVNGALVRRVGEKDASVPNMMRAIANVAISVGAVGCGVAVAIGTENAFRVLILLNAVTFLVAWVVLGRLPHYSPLPRPVAEEGPSQRWIAVRDLPFVAFSALSGLMIIQSMVILEPLPLWVVDHTEAPGWVVPLFLVVNTALIALFQVRVGKKVDTVTQGGAAMRRSGLVVLVSCALIGFATGIPGWAAGLLLVVVVGVHTFGELYYSSGAFAVGYGLAPEHAMGQYQGLMGTGMAVGMAMSPVLTIGVVLSLGTIGWVGLGVLFAICGLLMPVVARWGVSTRPAEDPAPDTAFAG